MTRIGINGKTYDFTGPVELPVLTCPVCRSTDLIDLRDIIDKKMLVPEMRNGVKCLGCGAVYQDEKDLNPGIQVFDDNTYDV